MLDQALEALKTYDWGVDPKVLQPIDEAIVSTHGNAAARKELEGKLIAVLKTDIRQAAKDAICRALKTIGTGASVPALAALLPDEKLSHMARYALERIPDPEAGQAMRDALPKVSAKLKIGIASSLGVRGEAKSVSALKTLLGDNDPNVVAAGAWALGTIGDQTAHQALTSAKNAPAAKTVIADALLGIAHKHLAAGKKTEAKATYEKVLASSPSAAAKEAATRGIEACK